MSASSKATPDWLVGFACSECLFSTKSGLSSQEHVEWHKQQDKLYKELEDKTMELGVSEAVNALNSYNPQRDQLVRELADMVRDMYHYVPGDYEESPKGREQFYLATLRVKARQLLKLYEEEKP